MSRDSDFPRFSARTDSQGKRAEKILIINIYTVKARIMKYFFHPIAREKLKRWEIPEVINKKKIQSNKRDATFREKIFLLGKRFAERHAQTVDSSL